MRHTILLVLLAVTLGAGDAAAQPTLPDIAGKWRGTAGTDLDRVEIGFDIQRDSAGRLKVLLYEPVNNFYGVELPGVLEVDSGAYLLRSYVLRLRPSGDSLEGSIFFNRAPVVVRRTTTFPAEVPVPELPRGPGPTWQVKLGSAVYAPATVRDSMVYVGTSGGMFYALHLRTGQFLWAFSVGRGVHGGALATDSAVYFAADDGRLYRLDRLTGQEIWRYELGDAQVPRVLMHQVVPNSGDSDWDLVGPTPVLVDSTLFVGSGDGSMHAVNLLTGARLWRSEHRGKIRGTAVIIDDRLFFGTFAGGVVALDRRTGEKLWEKGASGPVVTSVGAVGDRIIVGSRYGVLQALDAATGAFAWRVQLWGSSAEAEPLAADGSLFYMGASDLRRMSLMDAKDGRVLWRTDVYGWAWARPALAGQVLFVSTVGASPYQMRHLGALTALDRESGRILWRWAVPEPAGTWGYGFRAPPVVAGDRVIVGGLDGSLYAFTVR